jgi:hypothetical protein
MYLFLIWSTLLGCFCAPLYAQDLSEPIQKTPVRKKAALPAKPSAPDVISSVLLNFGTHTEFYNYIQTDDSGHLRKFEPAPTIGLGLKIQLPYQFLFLPEINWVLPRTNEDSRIIKNLFMLRLDLGYDLFDWFRLRAGTSTMWLNQHGRGGSTQVNNGNSTSTFYYPEENRSSINNTLDLGAELLISEFWSLRLQTYTYSIFKEERRQISYSIFLTYQWDQ